MAVLNSIGLLLLYISMAAAPPSVQRLTIHFSEYDRIELTREIGGWWYRMGSTGERVFCRTEGTRLFTGSSKEKPETTEMGTLFEIDAIHDWRKSQQFRAKETGARITTTPEENGILVRFQEREESFQIHVVWQQIGDTKPRRE